MDHSSNRFSVNKAHTYYIKYTEIINSTEQKHHKCICIVIATIFPNPYSDVDWPHCICVCHCFHKIPLLSFPD